ncbi:hypothetical protein ASD67_10715 [Sphingopyxis sp. Root1497]|nr:hypothetical protein ASD67_10715 [Sphingopyxis sp. Root1497]
MSDHATCSNMQTNAAGFEGWALALRLWLNTRIITLHWNPPAKQPDNPLNPHYARFLYRVQRFADLFPDWFRIGTPQHLDDCAVRTGADLYLNIAGASAERPESPKPEARLEWSLIQEHAPVLKKALNLRLLDRQFPVGLYRTANLTSPVFTGGTSAIDIVGTGDGHFTVIELKAGENIAVGALSELIFYAAVARDAATARFRFGGRKERASRATIGFDALEAATGIRAIYLAEAFHPLLDHPDLMRTLNDAAKLQATSLPLSFEQWLVEGVGSDPGPTFRNLSA